MRFTTLNVPLLYANALTNKRLDIEHQTNWWLLPFWTMNMFLTCVWPLRLWAFCKKQAFKNSRLARCYVSKIFCQNILKHIVHTLLLVSFPSSTFFFYYSTTFCDAFLVKNYYVSSSSCFYMPVGLTNWGRRTT